MKCPRWDVFISYNKADLQYAERVFWFLSKAGLRPFLSDISIAEVGNTDYIGTIERALDECNHMVVVASSVVNINSKWVQEECSIFLQSLLSNSKHGNLLTMLAGGLKVDNLPLILRKRQALSLTADGLTRLLRFVCDTASGVTATHSSERRDDDNRHQHVERQYTESEAKSACKHRDLRVSAGLAESAGNFAEARGRWQECLAISPDDKEAKVAEERLGKLIGLLAQAEEAKSRHKWLEASAILSEANRLSGYSPLLADKINDLRQLWVEAETTESRNAETLRLQVERERGREEQKDSPVSLKIGEPWSEPVTGMEFVWLSGGFFRMGSPNNEDGRDIVEGPVRDVCVDGFWMGKHEVTNAQYRKFKPHHDSGAFKGISLNGSSQPVVQVSWEEARAFALWLSSKNSVEFRLPTEAQWEYAARGGTQTSRFWGDDPDLACKYANVYEITGKKTFGWSWCHHFCNSGHAVSAPVGSFLPNAFGLYDMLGNVREWCLDIYASDAYTETLIINPEITGGGSERVVRGGDWHSAPKFVRSACRQGDDSRGRGMDLGFRLVIKV